MSAVNLARPRPTTGSRRGSVFIPQDVSNLGFKSSRGWLMHARYVRGEHAACAALAADALRGDRHAHRYAYFIQGMVLADAGRLQEALERFHSCIRLQPREPEPLKHVAKCLYRQRRYQLALEAYTEAQKLSEKPDPDILCCIAECAAQLGNISRGVELANAAVDAGGGERAAALLSRLLVQVGDMSGALVALEGILSGNACSAETLASAGALRLRSGDPRRAFQLLGAALAQKPTYHPAALALAAMMLEHRDEDAALARLRTALTAHPECVAAYADLGLALLSKRKFVAAVTCLQRAATAAPLSARAAHNLGLALLMGRRVASAFCRLAAAAALDPGNARTVMLIAVALERLKDSRADAAYVRAAIINPADAFIRYNLAARHARTGRLSHAAEEAGIVARILDAEESPDEQLSSSLATLVSQLEQRGTVLEWRQSSTTTEANVSELPHDIAPDEV